MGGLYAAACAFPFYSTPSTRTMVMVMVLNSDYTGPLPHYLYVAPAPCFARARPCLDVWWGEPFLVQRPLCWPTHPSWHPWEVPRARAASQGGTTSEIGRRLVMRGGRGVISERNVAFCFWPGLLPALPLFCFFFSPGVPFTRL